MNDENYKKTPLSPRLQSVLDALPKATALPEIPSGGEDEREDEDFPAPDLRIISAN